MRASYQGRVDSSRGFDYNVIVEPGAPGRESMVIHRGVLHVFSVMSFAVGLSAQAGRAWATLAPGDIAIIGYQSSDPDTLAFVALAPIAAGEVIRLTDS